MKKTVTFMIRLFVSALRVTWMLALILALLGPADVGHAAPVAQAVCPDGSICVNTLLDEKKGNDGLCSLREAIIAANSDKPSGGKPGECDAGSGADTIRLVAPPDPSTGVALYALSRTDNGNEDASQTGDVDIAGDLTIVVDGPGATIDAGGITDRVFHILDGNVTITGVALKNGGSNVSQGAGIFNAGDLTLANVTISGNSAIGSGGGVYNTGTLTLNNVTIAHNTANDAGGISNGGGTLVLSNTIVADNSPYDCSGSLSSGGYNLFGDNTCGPALPSDITNVDPRLGPLQNNGGQTETHALLAGSPAIDAGDNAACLAADQRGEVRPLDGDYDGQAVCDMGAFELRRNNFVLIRAFLNAEGGTTLQGLLNGYPDTTLSLDLYRSTACSASDVSPVGELEFNDVQVTTDENGYFTAQVGAFTEPVVFVNATATGPGGNPIGFSNCVSFGSNTSWPFALSLDDYDLFQNGTAEIEQYIDKLGESRWYRFKVEPNSEVVVTLTDLPENYDLTIYKDIKEAFLAFLIPQEDDLVPLNAQFAGDAFSGDAFSGDAFSGDAFSGDAFSGDAFSGDAFSGDAFSGDAFSGDAFSGDAFSGDAFSGDAFSGDAFSGDAFSGDAFSAPVFSGDAFSGDAFSGDAFSAAFSSAQTRSLIGVSAFEGIISEGIFVNSWNNTGEFYVRVRGRNGAFSLDAPFHLEVNRTPGDCGAVPPLPDTDPLAPVGNPKTLILTDLSRMDRVQGTPDEKAALLANLDALAGRAEVNGLVVDVSQDARVNGANDKADDNPECPYAKNLVAQAIKDIVDGYRTQPDSNLEYLVIVGGDEIISSFRHPDNALLAPESQYSPPVKNTTASQASLKLDYVLSHDAYGSRFDLSLNNSTYPVPELAVGRLVETATEMQTVIDAYLNHTDNGVVAPQTSLTAGYDFLYDAALAIRDELAAGTPGADNDLLTARAPSDPPHPELWTADQLRQALLPAGGQAPDIAFLAGHFTTNAALAADYVTTMSASEVASSDADLINSVIFSAGCHAGYNTVDEHGLNIVDQNGEIIVTKQPDWAQAFAGKGATLVAGTGYQYGETDYLEYSERIYLEFSRQLRRAGPVAIGKALMEAKKVYLAQTPQIRGLHEKALLETSIFGLPFLKVDLVGDYTPPAAPGQTPALSSFANDPGLTLELQYGDITVESPLNETTVSLTDVDDGSPVQASYLSGTPFGDNQGVASYLGEPALPLEVRDVTVPGTNLRGVGWRGGRYQQTDVIPLSGAPATEVSGVHTPFLTDYFYPVLMWRVNYWDVLDNPNVGITHLMVTPAQHKISSTLTDPQTSTRRQFRETDLRLYYSNNATDYSTQEGVRSIPALSGPPVIVRVSAQPDNGVVSFEMLVTSNPAAGVQEVWVTYTDTGLSCPAGGAAFCEWKSLDLTQSPLDSTIWRGQLDLAGITAVENIRYMVQAANGVGLVGRADNLGKHFVPGVVLAGTNLEITSAPTGGHFSDKATFSARLTDGQPGGAPIGGQPVTFRLASLDPQQGGLASVSGVALTAPDGVATVNLPLRALPGNYKVSAFFAGSATLQPSLAAGGTFTINRQVTAFCSEEFPGVEAECVLNAVMLPDPEADTGIVAVLTDDRGRRLRERSVFFEVSNDSNTYSVHTITDWRGRAFLGPVSLPAGVYEVTVSFINGTLDLPNNLGYPIETVELLDDGYNPATATGSLTLNAPPVADAGGPYTGDEGALITLDGSLSVDTPGDSIVSYQWDLEYDGVTFDVDVDASTLSTTDVSFPDDFPERIIALRVSDTLGAEDVATTTLTVFNVAPTVTAMDQGAVAGQVSDLEIATFTDPGVLDTHYAAIIDWGDGTSCDTRTDPDCAVTEAGGSGSVTGSHTYATIGEYAISVQVCDDDGACGSPDSSPIVTVDPAPNQPPTADAGGPYAADEGAAVGFDGSASQDPDGDALTYTWDFGDGNVGNGVTVDHAYPDNGAYNVTLTVTDPSGESDSHTTTATIANVPPSVEAGDDQTVFLGDPVYGSATFSDPGSLDTHAASIDWGDATVEPGIVDQTLGTVSGSHIYSAPGEYIATVIVADDDGDFGQDSFTVTVTEVAAVSDPQTIWPPNGRMVPVTVIVLNPDVGTLTITSIRQDEPVGGEPDAEIISGDTVNLRAERDGNGNGRVYHIFFTFDDGQGGTYSGEVKTAIVPHDQSGDIDNIDEGALYDSMTIP